MIWLLAGCGDGIHRLPGERDSAGDTAGDTGADTAADTAAAEPLDVVVNELMPRNESTTAYDGVTYADWLELYNAGDAAVDLAGWSLSDERDEAKHVFPTGVSLAPRDFLLLWADGLPDIGRDHLDFSLSGDGGELVLRAPDGHGSVLTYGAVEADYSLSRAPDGCLGDGCWTWDFRGTPGTTNVPEDPLEVELLPVGSTWRWWDAGTSPGDGWAAPGFDDSAWESGPGPLGFGDTHQVSAVDGGPDTARYVTTWFRATVSIQGASGLSALRARLMRDDSAVVYVNGVEAWRTNLPDGDLTADTLAERSVSGYDETAYWEAELDPALLVEGDNTIAVEVHQAGVTSSDLSFDLGLLGEVVR